MIPEVELDSAFPCMWEMVKNIALSGIRVLPIRWLKWCTYCRCLRKHLKCHFLQIELNNWLLHMLQESIIVSLVEVSVEQLIYLFLTMCCLLPIPPRTLQKHPCPLGRKNCLNKDGCGWGTFTQDTHHHPEEPSPHPRSHTLRSFGFFRGWLSQGILPPEWQLLVLLCVLPTQCIRDV
jgi:hypothetical protein